MQLSSVESMLNCDEESLSHCQLSGEDFLHVPMVVCLQLCDRRCLDIFLCFQLCFNHLCCFLVLRFQSSKFDRFSLLRSLPIALDFAKMNLSKGKRLVICCKDGQCKYLQSLCLYYALYFVSFLLKLHIFIQQDVDRLFPHCYCCSHLSS